MENVMVIYKTTNLVNGKQYIGKDGHNNPNYLGSGTFLKMAIKKYGKHNFKKEILEVCETEEQMRVREEYWLNYYDAANNKMFYNIHNHSYGSGGGEKNPMYGKTLSEDHKKKISQSTKGISKPMTDEHKKNLKCHSNNLTKVSCPHCGKEGQLTNMKRWHFDKCKSIPKRSIVQPE